MSLNACWSMADRRLGREERQALRTFSARKSRLPAPIHELLRHAFHEQCTNASHLLVETDCVFTAPRTFPFLGVMFRHTLRVNREMSLISRGSSGSASSFPHHLWAGPAPPFNA